MESINKKKNLSLSNLHRQELEKNSLSKIKGGAKEGSGGNCACGCNGPSSTCDNSKANYAGSLTTPGLNPISCPYPFDWVTFCFALGLGC